MTSQKLFDIASTCYLVVLAALSVLFAASATFGAIFIVAKLGIALYRDLP